MPLTDFDVKRVAEAVVKKLRKVDQLELLRPADVAQMLGCQRTYLYEMMKSDPDFPKPFYLPNSRVRVWKRVEVEDYVAKTFKRDV